MRRGFLPAAAGLTAVLTLAACVPQGEFPSLARRPAEREISTEAPARPQVVVPSDAALRQRVTELQRLAAEGDQAFDAAFGATAAAVGKAGSEGSGSWVDAQQAISRLETVGEPTTRALAELDQLAIGRSDQPTSAEDYTAINEAIAAVERISAAQQQRVDGLKVRLGR